jgi:hypothetical protein
MEDEKLEFFKLDTIDRKVLFWIMNNIPESIRSWVEHIESDYKQSKSVQIDRQKLYEEIKVAMDQVEGHLEKRK